MKFAQAIEALKDGETAFRAGWNNGMIVVYQKGRAGDEGDLFKSEPYNGSSTMLAHSVWSPSSKDVLAEDWGIIK